MKAATIAVHWHDDNHPIYSLDFQPAPKNCRQVSRRLATGGGDNNVRIWRVQYPRNAEDISIEYLSTLRKHTQAVNVVRFDPSGQMLATGGDDGFLVIWTLAEKIISEFGHQDDDVQESWVARYVHKTSLEIYDLAWAPDSMHIITGSMDNTAKVYSVQTGQLCELANHSHYVQGVSWDPLNEFLATQSADRSVVLYSLGPDSNPTPAYFFRASRLEIPVAKLSKGQVPSCGGIVELEKIKKLAALYHPETLQSFFRRLAFSPDGSLLLTPLGVFRNHEENVKLDKDLDKDEKADALDDSPTFLNTVYIYIRAGLNRGPVCHLPGLAKPAIAVSFNPNTYKLSSKKPVFALPYKMVFAVATQDSVIVYDTEHLQPLGLVSNLHYLTITDLCWEQDGLLILVSSAEGFCSAIMFEPDTFGPLADANVEVSKRTPKTESPDPSMNAQVLQDPPKSIPTSVPGIILVSPASVAMNPRENAGVNPTAENRDDANVSGASGRDAVESVPIDIPVGMDVVESADKPESTIQSANANFIEQSQLSVDKEDNETNGEYSGDNASVQLREQSTAPDPKNRPAPADNTTVTQSMLDQFMAKPLVAPAPIALEAGTDEGSKRPAGPSEHEPEKKRVTPTPAENLG